MTKNQRLKDTVVKMAIKQFKENMKDILRRVVENCESGKELYRLKRFQDDIESILVNYEADPDKGIP